MNLLYQTIPSINIEILIPDFKGNFNALQKVLQVKPAVLNHNLETVKYLYSKVRPQADYYRSLTLLAKAKEFSDEILTKSGIMVGLGETPAMVLELLKDLRKVGCDILTIGQYYQPTHQCLPVNKYLSSEDFAYYQEKAYELGFKYVAAGPFVRSSYQAGYIYQLIKESH